MPSCAARCARRSEVCTRHGADLIVNDYWQIAIDERCSWVHLGQEDLVDADVKAIRRAGLKLGVSTHDHAELEKGLAVDPDYVALGPIWPTALKKMPWAPQGLERHRRMEEADRQPAAGRDRRAHPRTRAALPEGRRRLRGRGRRHRQQPRSGGAGQGLDRRDAGGRMTDRYARQTILAEVGAAGQARLAAASVLVVGAGGLGCPVLQYLAGAGVGHLAIVDHDTVEETNLHRQPLYGMGDIGKPKAEAARIDAAALQSGHRDRRRRRAPDAAERGTASWRRPT